jgi:hypothetical protein
VIFAISFYYARRQEKKARSRTDDAARELLTDERTPQ